MKAIANFDEIINFTTKIKNINNLLITNLPINVEKVSKWIAMNQLFYLETEKSFFVLRNNFNYYHLYYISSSIENLFDDLKKFTENFSPKIVIDIFGETIYLDTVCKKLYEIGFTIECKLFRMSKINLLSSANSNSSHTSKGKIKPHEEYIEEISDLLKKNFDIIIDQIPTKSEISNFIKSGNALLSISKDKSLKGFILYNKKNKTAIMKYLFVLPKYRNLGVAGKLMNDFMSLCKDTRRLVLWVAEHNANAIAIYKRYGFVSENMFNIVLIKKNKNEK